MFSDPCCSDHSVCQFFLILDTCDVIGGGNRRKAGVRRRSSFQAGWTEKLGHGSVWHKEGLFWIVNHTKLLRLEVWIHTNTHKLFIFWLKHPKRSLQAHSWTVCGLKGKIQGTAGCEITNSSGEQWESFQATERLTNIFMLTLFHQIQLSDLHFISWHEKCNAALIDDNYIGDILE